MPLEATLTSFLLYVFYLFNKNINFIALTSGILSDAVFVADKSKQAIFVSSQSTSDRTFVSLPFQNITSPHGIAFNPLDGRLYWTDSSRGVVARSSINGQDQEDIHWNVVRPLGIALDLVGGNVYWISSGGTTIEVSKLNGGNWKELHSNLSPTAREITLDTKRGYVCPLSILDYSGYQNSC